jgi:hypothetical protein
MWLTGRLMPDFKTIANFRKDNGKAIRRVCSQFVALCRELNLFSQELQDTRTGIRRRRVCGDFIVGAWKVALQVCTILAPIDPRSRHHFKQREVFELLRLLLFGSEVGFAETVLFRWIKQ